jgi:hypothetical protein
MSSEEVVPTISVPVIALTEDGPFFKQYYDFDKRLRSFDSATQDTFPPHSIMAKAGFFSTGVSDTVVCFYCGVCLNSWNEFDSPWLEHQVHSPDCAYLILNRHSVFQDVRI